MPENQVPECGGLPCVTWFFAEISVPGAWLKYREAARQPAPNRRVPMAFSVLRVGNRAGAPLGPVTLSIAGCTVLDCAGTPRAS